jgi:ABC-2 type transport system ATP-binding protein
MIKLENIGKFLSKKEIIKNMSLKIDEPLIYGLLGLNGAGKTTTIRLICDILKPDSGTITKTDTIKNVNHIGYMPEEVGLYNDMTILQEIIYFGKLHGMSKEEALNAAMPLIKKFDLSANINKPIGLLSKGTSRKVQFICTIIHSPQIIILDEPFSGLDPFSSQVLEQELINLKNKGKTIILSTHRMEHAELFCDHIFIIHKGEKIIDESMQELKIKNKKNAFEIHVLKEVNLDNESINYEKKDMDGYHKYMISLQDNLKIEPILNDMMLDNELIYFKQETPSLKEIFLTKTINN